VNFLLGIHENLVCWSQKNYCYLKGSSVTRLYSYENGFYTVMFGTGVLCFVALNELNIEFLLKHGSDHCT
jgi:hypothetical protein